MTPLLYNEAEARRMIGDIGRSKFYELVKEGKITPTKIGRRTFFSAAELERFVASLDQGKAA